MMNMQNINGAVAIFLKKITLKRFLILLLIIFAILGAGGSYYFYEKYRVIKFNPNLEARKKTEALVSAVGELIELPQDEVPTVATIIDKEKLNDQPFFKAGENGDKLLAYNVAMVAILYRPSTNKIINVATITISQPQNSAHDVEQNASILAPLRIAYYNGTETAGLAGLAEKAVQEKYPNYQTITVTNASRKDYGETLVIDLSGKHGKEASDLAKLLNGEIGDLPQDEVAPEADILIISGK